MFSFKYYPSIVLLSSPFYSVPPRKGLNHCVVISDRGVSPTRTGVDVLESTEMGDSHLSFVTSTMTSDY